MSEQGELAFEDARIVAFRAFHEKNPHVYAAFCRFALEAAQRRRHYSSRDVIHRVRWWSMIESDDPDGWKINNNWSPFYGRLFELEHPRLVGFFEHRTSIADAYCPRRNPGPALPA